MTLKLSTKLNSKITSASNLLALTIRKLGTLKNANPEQDALDILCYVWRKPKQWFYTDDGHQTSARHKSRVEQLVRERLTGIPLPYITRRLTIGDIGLYINRHVLVPRPATEILIDAAKRWLAINYTKLNTSPPCHCERPLGERGNLGESGDCFAPLGLAMTDKIQIYDIGTGSGVIALAIARYCRVNTIKSQITATDISKNALAVAQRNIRKYNLVSTIKTQQTNLLDAIRKPADLIVANLPYLSPLESKVLADPRAALVGGKAGHETIVELLRQTKHRRLLKPRGAIMLEIGHNQTKPIRAVAYHLFPQANMRVLKDLEGWNRVLTIQAI